MEIISHTIVKNGKPFIGLVLEQVLPFVDKSFITVSKASNDGTLKVLEDLYDKYPHKLEVDFENVAKPGLLTGVRQKQLDKTPSDSWVLFLDDDDFWPESSLKMMVEKLDEDVDGFSIDPIQLIDKESQDWSWRHKSFTKWFKKTPQVHYKGAWPQDLIYKGDEILYWRKNDRVPRLKEPKFFHLSHLKNYSFRDQTWADTYRQDIGPKQFIPKKYQKYVERIYECIE